VRADYKNGTREYRDFKKNTDTIILKLIIGIVFFLILVVLLIAYLVQNHNNENIHSENRYDALVTSKALKESSDDLTKFIRFYAATGNTYYKEAYNQVLAIRNGELGRPDDYHHIYWDLLNAEYKLSETDNEPISLNDLFEIVKLTEEEKSLLREAEENSNKLVELERLSMRAIEGNLTEEDRRLIRKDETTEDFALRILLDEDYLQAKAEIMKPISTFYDLLKNRTKESYDLITFYQNIYVLLLSMLIFFFVLYICVYFSKLLGTFKQIELILSNEISVKEDELVENNSLLDTTKKELEESKKLAEVGQMVSETTHEVCTPLGVTITSATAIKQKSENVLKDINENRLSKSSLNKHLNEVIDFSNLISSNINHAFLLIQSLKIISVDQTISRKRDVDISEYMNEIKLSMYSKLKKKHIDLEVNGGQGIIINIDPSYIYQIFSNLINNSLIHGFEDKQSGQINISIRTNDSLLYMEYIDNGKGISEENIKNIFDKFFTTKKDDGGSGIGLNVVYLIINEKLNGRITCQSTLGEGVKFIIELPM